MSAPGKIVDANGQPVQPGLARITNVAALPSVWDRKSNLDWLVGGMISRESVNLVSGPSGEGKSWLAYGIAGAVAHGKEFIGCKVQQAPVLYLDGENPLYVVQRNLTDLGINATEQLRVWGGWNDEGPPGPADPRIRQFATSKPLLIWDSLVEFARCDEQSADEMRRFMRRFRRLAHLGATVIVLHHTGKSATAREYRGSTDIKASVDMAYLITGTPKDRKLHRLEMNPFKSRIAPGQEFAMEFWAGQGFKEIKHSKPGPQPSSEDIIRDIVRHRPESNATQIKKEAKEFGLGKNVVDKILKNGEYTFRPGKGAERLYTLRQD